MKLLLVRFSSIGDLVLTTPVVRALAQSPQKYEIHFITKEKFKATLIHNPYIDKLYTFSKEITEIETELKAEHYDYIIDLHSNIRSRRLSVMLHCPTKRFNKINYEKWLKVNFKWNTLPDVHIVDRYMDTISFLGLQYDGMGLDYFITDEDEKIFETIQITKNTDYNVLVIGGAHQTKQIPDQILVEIGKSSAIKTVLLGGKEDSEKAKKLSQQIGDQCVNLAGELSLNQSAALIKYAHKIVSPDTGLMHIAAAMKKEIITIWGNTIPEFGMSALMPKAMINKNINIEVEGLKCRPCSKIGYKTCPKKHFDCMEKQDVQKIIELLNE